VGEMPSHGRGEAKTLRRGQR